MEKHSASYHTESLLSNPSSFTISKHPQKRTLRRAESQAPVRPTLTLSAVK